MIVEHTNNWDSSSENSLANAVGSTALQSIRDKLPQWGYYSPESGVHLNRNEPSSTASIEDEEMVLKRTV